ncbi:uncharacterized protein LOC141537310 [Cotesia typhae]|uniref:uncharacterized protein LOC141537310 n=1 Tax=Cotesia typhae TaxID=2053667 RepID=UPI003D69C7F8
MITKESLKSITITDYVFIEYNFLYPLKMNTIIDFNGFYNSDDKYVIKEFSICMIRDGSNEASSTLHGVSKFQMEWKALSKKNKTIYENYFKIYGIEWKKGTYLEKFVVQNLWEVLRNTKTVYLLYKGKRDSLANYLSDDLNFKFEYLKDLGFVFKPDLYTKCRFHNNKSKNNCANDNVLKMVKWFTQKPIDHFRMNVTQEKSLNQNLTPNTVNLDENINIVIDFNGYYLSENDFRIKEYSMYLIDAKSNQVVLKEFDVSAAPMLWGQLDNQQRGSYDDYYLSHGIEWSYGSLYSESIESNLRNKFCFAKKIFVQNQKKHELLIEYLNYDFKAIYLTDFGLEVKNKMVTECKNHTEPRRYNCANDNVLRMLSLLSSYRPKKESVVIDFNGYLINHKYVIKEYSLYIIEDGTYKIVRNDIEVSKPPIKKNQVELDAESEMEWKKFYSRHGIDWDFGTLDYKLTKSRLEKVFREKSIIYVLDENKHKLLLSYSDDNLAAKFVYLNDYNFYFRPTMSTKCTYHQQKFKNNCANDNVERMLDWLANTKPQVDGPSKLKANNVKTPIVSGLKIPKVSTKMEREIIRGLSKVPQVQNPIVRNLIKPSRKQIIVDFYGYYLLNSVYMIRELNAIIVDKRSADDKDLYLIVKAPNNDDKNLNVNVKKNMIVFYNTHRIAWDTGDVNFEQVSDILTKYFATATHIYVKNVMKQKLLKKFIGERNDIFCLEDMHFREKPITQTYCKNHDSTDSICAVDNSKAMVKWFRRNFIGGNSLRSVNSTENSKTELSGNTNTGTKRKLRSFSEFRNKIKNYVMDGLSFKK